MDVLGIVKATNYEIKQLPMLSCNAVDYVTDVSSRNFISICQVLVRELFGGVKSFDYYNIFIAQLTKGTSFTQKFTTFANHVVRIFLRCSHKEMIGIYASRIIALMTNVMAFWNRAVEMLIRNSMRGSRIAFSLSSANSHNSVATRFYDRSFPKPTATIRLNDVSLNSYFNRNIFAVFSFIHAPILYEIMGGTP